jgi:hypothetical protein
LGFTAGRAAEDGAEGCPEFGEDFDDRVRKRLLDGRAKSVDRRNSDGLHFGTLPSLVEEKDSFSQNPENGLPQSHKEGCCRRK